MLGKACQDDLAIALVFMKHTNNSLIIFCWCDLYRIGLTITQIDNLDTFSFLALDALENLLRITFCTGKSIYIRDDISFFQAGLLCRRIQKYVSNHKLILIV